MSGYYRPPAVQPVRRLDAANVEMRGTNIDTAVSELQISYTAVWRYNDNAWCMTAAVPRLKYSEKYVTTWVYRAKYKDCHDGRWVGGLV